MHIRHLILSVFILQVSCNYSAKYAIDKVPVPYTDSGILGIWKAKEDTNKYNYFLVQSAYDLFQYSLSQYNGLDAAGRNEYKPTLRFNYLTFQNNRYLFYITYMGHGGRNPVYGEWSCSLSNVRDNRFLNFGLEGILGDYVFARLIKINKTYDTIIAAMVADTTLKNLNSSNEIRNKISKNFNSPLFYSDTMHFYRVSSYHTSMSGSINFANAPR